jgi:hypothetical protein
MKGLRKELQNNDSEELAKLVMESVWYQERTRLLVMNAV